MYQFSLVLVVIALVVVGLNISNQGINSLTRASRGPIVGCKVEDQLINVFALGEKYSYAKEDLWHKLSWAGEQVVVFMHSVKDYLVRIWIVSRALILFLGLIL